MKKRGIILIVAIFLSLLLLAGCIDVDCPDCPDCPDIPENLPPTIELVSPPEDRILTRYEAATEEMCVNISDPEGQLMKIEFYWRTSDYNGPHDWVDIVDVTGYNDTYCYDHIPKYRPYVREWEDNPQYYEWRVDVSDGLHVVTELFNVRYMHPVLWPLS